MSESSDSLPTTQAPHDVDAEMAVLGTLLFDNRLLDRLEHLQASDFYFRQHQIIFTHMQTLIQTGSVADGITLKERLAREQHLSEVGGPRYLATLLGHSAALSHHAVHYADIVRAHALRRSIIDAAYAAIKLATAPDDSLTAEGVLSEVQKGFDLNPTGPVVLKTISQAADSFIEGLAAEYSQALSTGYPTLDRRLGGGLFRGDLIILCGRPSMGKTSLADNFARNMARAKRKVGMVSEEMSAEALSMRALSAASYAHSDTAAERFAYTHLRNGARDIDRALLARYAATLKDMPLIIDDRPGLTIKQIEWTARAMRRALGGLDALFIDYLQILSRPEAKGRNDATVIGEMTVALKNLARRMGIAIVCLSQLSRQVESREDKRPTLSDLRESGAIEQDADVVLGVYREGYYLERSEPPASASDDKIIEWRSKIEQVREQVEVITLKQRNGPVGNDILKALLQHDVILDAR